MWHIQLLLIHNNANVMRVPRGNLSNLIPLRYRRSFIYVNVTEHISCKFKDLSLVNHWRICSLFLSSVNVFLLLVRYQRDAVQY